MSAPVDRDADDVHSDAGSRTRIDFAALRDRRLLKMFPVVLLALFLPFIGRATLPLWIGGTDVAHTRLLGRICMDFVVMGCYPAALVIMRLGMSEVRPGEHRALLAAFPVLVSVWQCIAAVDGVLLVVWPERFSLPLFWFDFILTFFSVVPILGIRYASPWFYGFDPRALLEARASLATDHLEMGVTPIDTLDYRVLQLLARSGSDIARVMINDIGIGHRDMVLRLAKLTALGYVEVVKEMHGTQVVLTTRATDTLALPVSLFVWNTDDKDTLVELAAARLSLEAREPQKVVVACARLCETLLKKLIAQIEPKVTHIAGKELSKATLGELMQAARQHKRIGRFEDSLFSAINERRKKIHAREGEAPIDDNDAFAIYTLTEMVAREVLRGPKTDAAEQSR